MIVSDAEIFVSSERDLRTTLYFPLVFLKPITHTSNDHRVVSDAPSSTLQKQLLHIDLGSNCWSDEARGLN